MKFELSKAKEILEQTPTTLRSLLSNLSEEWLKNNEGENTWSPYDVIGHMVHGEKTDWITRTKIILGDSENKKFEPFDRSAHLNKSKEVDITALLGEFETLRSNNLQELESLHISEDDLTKKGIHPAFGEVTLAQLISTWAVHDLNHIAQITRVMANQYKAEVGPWFEYLRILKI